MGKYLPVTWFLCLSLISSFFFASSYPHFVSFWESHGSTDYSALLPTPAENSAAQMAPGKEIGAMHHLSVDWQKTNSTSKEMTTGEKMEKLVIVGMFKETERKWMFLMKHFCLGNQLVERIVARKYHHSNESLVKPVEAAVGLFQPSPQRNCDTDTDSHIKRLSLFHLNRNLECMHCRMSDKILRIDSNDEGGRSANSYMEKL